VSFTKLAARVSPTQLVDLLNEIFSRFDRLQEIARLCREISKIKTIGDAYMVVGGLPVHRPDHAEAIALMALDMQQEILPNLAPGEPFSIRIGINSRPVVAGVIGLKKFIYDLWGDTVNIASRMESHGIPGAIQVTQETYDILKDKFLFQKQGVINVKGKG
jgi:class 3 adenylate cyclase